MEPYGTALILGYGRSGQAAERLLNAEGTKTQVLSQETSGDAELKKALKGWNHDVCIVSPGFSLAHPWVMAVRDAGIPLLSELELGWSRHQGRTIAITGSNGKSTAVKWVYESLLEAGKKAEIGGNYGIPACEVVQKHPELEWLVLEVSSFQLETISRLQADIKVVLNIHPNHLDRHGDMEIYWRTKARIFGSISLPEDACLVPISWLDRFRREVGSDRNWITFGNSDLADYHFDQGIVYRKSEKMLDLTGTLFDSPVIGACTGAAMGAIASAAEIPAQTVETAARRFQPLPYRMQKLGKIGGVSYINDSKATNLAAMAAAIEAAGKGVHLIAGGLPKESDYTFVKEILAERVRSIYLTGQASRAMYQAWNGVCPCVECGTLKEAFNTAKKAAEAGETILLSPGCASFDQFVSFEERGAYFDTLYHDALRAGGDAV
jgi:UDP-N-acetylmuramoylalanine--D-glutamate ligase